MAATLPVLDEVGRRPGKRSRAEMEMARRPRAAEAGEEAPPRSVPVSLLGGRRAFDEYKKAMLARQQEIERRHVEEVSRSHRTVSSPLDRHTICVYKIGRLRYSSGTVCVVVVGVIGYTLCGAVVD